MEKLEKLLTDREAANFLGLAVQTLRNMRVERRGPAYFKLGARVLYRLSDLEAWLEKHRVVPGGGE